MREDFIPAIVHGAQLRPLAATLGIQFAVFSHDTIRGAAQGYLG